MRVFACYNKNAIADVIVPVPSIDDAMAVMGLSHMHNVTPEPHNVIIVESSGKGFCFGESIFAGVRNSRTDIYVLYNDDMFPEAGWLTKLKEAFDDYPNLGICGGVQYDPKTGNISHLGGRFNQPPCTAYALPGPDPNDPVVQEFLRVRTTPPLRGSQVIFSDWQNGGFLAIRKKVWDELGGLDTTFRMYWEDVDIGYRAQQIGYDVGVHRGIVAAHIGGASKNETGITQDVTRDVMVRKLYEERKRQGFNAKSVVKEAKYLYNVNQVPSEIETLSKIVYSLAPKVVVEIGTERGGTFFIWSKTATDATLVSIDRSPIPIMVSGDSHLITGDTHSIATIDRLKEILKGRLVDFLFIDGDHTYEGVKLDYEMFAPLVRKRGIIAFHDICRHPPSTGCFVRDYWVEVKRGKNCLEIIERPEQDWAGIGVIFKT